MPNARLIKRRIKSAQNIAKITKAMEMVSASKMRRAQAQAQASQPYSHHLHRTLHTIASFTNPELHPLLQAHPTGRPLLILISTDRGLCGGLNTLLFKAAVEFERAHANFTTLVVGRKAQEFASRMGWHITASFTHMPEKIGFNDIVPIAQMAREGFLGDEFSEVSILHMEFVNTLTQRPHATSMLPLKREDLTADSAPLLTSDYVFEPNPHEILDWLLPYYVEVELYQLFLDARASEHSARMVSMQNASKNAKEVVGALKLEYNKSRQAAITQELIEITTTKEHA